MKHIKGIIFDAEGVVVNTESLWDKSQELLLSRRGLAYDRDYLKPKMAGQTLLEGARLMVDYYDLDEVPTDLEGERKVLIHTLFEQEIALVDGFSSFIKEINQTKLKKSIATAMPKSLMRMVLQRLDLKRYFDQHIYHIEDVGDRSKPHPDVFLFAAKRMGLAPQECIVIEDAPHGIEAANRAGSFSIGIATTFTSLLFREADYVATDFFSILQFLRMSGLDLTKSKKLFTQ